MAHLDYDNDIPTHAHGTYPSCLGLFRSAGSLLTEPTLTCWINPHSTAQLPLSRLAYGSAEMEGVHTSHLDETKGERRETSLEEPGQHDRRAPIIRRSSVLPVRVRKLTQDAGAMLTRLSKFLVVGVTGILVNSLALFLLFQWAHLPLVVASALSTEVAIVNNFCWNDRWTFGRAHLSLNRFALFNLVSLAGLIITTGTLWFLVRRLGCYYLTANLLGIGLATAWNFVANSLWTWGGA